MNNLPVSMTYQCGCVNELDDVTGAYHSAMKCAYHKEWAENHREGQDYYERIGTVDYGGIVDTQHVMQLLAALPRVLLGVKAAGSVLEVGCGASPFASWLKHLGMLYVGIDQSEWAARWTADNHDVETFKSSIEDWSSDNRYDLILASHVLEHLSNAPAMLKKMVSMLSPGGHIIIIVPDDEDPVNPDHLWFFTEPTLRLLMKDLGLINIDIAIRRVVHHERFIYAIGRLSS